MQRRITVFGLVVMIGTLALVGSQNRLLATQGATPSASPTVCPTTTPEENADMVRRYWNEVYNERHPEVAADYLADDFVRQNPGRPQVNEPGNDDDVQRARENLEDFPDLHITVEDVIADGDRVVARLTWTGTQQAPLETWGAPVTGRAATWQMIAIYTVRCGQLAEQWIAADYLGMLRQLGVVTDDELQTIGTPTVATPAP